ncbi:hypothetical protein O1M54_02855 [Streptomyces diastatochromogenes]|nr:hypothetical protein [Streptomyces diastatochromogenes]
MPNPLALATSAEYRERKSSMPETSSPRPGTAGAPGGAGQVGEVGVDVLAEGVEGGAYGGGALLGTVTASSSAAAAGLGPAAARRSVGRSGRAVVSSERRVSTRRTPRTG